MLETPGTSVSSATRARNKYEMIKTVWETYPEDTPSFKLMKEEADLSNISFPCVLKPISSSGAKGIYYAENEKQMKDAFYGLINLGKEGHDQWNYNRYGLHFLCKSYLSDQEVSVAGVVVNEECYITGIGDKKVTEPWFTEYQYIFQTRLNDEVKIEIEKATYNIVNVLGLKNTPFHLEARWTKDGFKFIEIAARIRGGVTTTHIVSNALGINWIKNVVSALINNEVVEIPKVKTYTGIHYSIATQAGRLKHYEYPEDLRHSKAFLHAKYLIKNGDIVLLPPEDFSYLLLGYILAKGENYSEVANFFKKVSEETMIEVE
ncbi:MULTISPECIES: ATP-grasp domain-containing protein [unclassified Bartonella]|uniref:ATP-grasp domain-containing protein n=1 Tax=unclassified Bartonella TaxID=2645622 RepID=UPI00235E4099|nr:MULTISPECIES: ATP-grasp domain-containing protein [unclassified Bartonella]